jgi:dTDP-glucose 4,6-dehydratase
VRDWLYVEDHSCRHSAGAAARAFGEKYNIGGNNERRNIDIVDSICAVLDEFSRSP